MAALNELGRLQPDNAYIDLLAARLAFRNNDPGEALRRITGSGKKAGFADYREPFEQLIAEMYVGMKGLDPLTARGAVLNFMSYDSNEMMMGVGRSLEKNMKIDFGSNPAKVHEKAAMGISIAQRMQETTDLANYRQGLQMETSFLKYMSGPEAQTYLSKPVQEYMQELEREREASKSLLTRLREIGEGDPVKYQEYLLEASQIGQIPALQKRMPATGQ